MTIETIQDRLEKQVIGTCQSNPTVGGFAQAMKELCREYDKIPFFYDVNTPDFLSFVTKLSNETMEKLKFNRIELLRRIIHAANLKLKISEHDAFGIISAMLSTINAKETISILCDYFSAFDFMVDSLIPNIFEEE